MQTPTAPKTDAKSMHIDVGRTAWGHVGLQFDATACSNPECMQLELNARLIEYGYGSNGGYRLTAPPTHQTWRLLPESAAKPWPDFIPQQIRDDYREACLIRHLSPKASATLARRCLQGMIRDFGRVKPGRLYDEIEELANAVRDGTAPRDVSIDSIAALTSLRKIGNIGAHMEADVDIIVAVDENEAGALIGLIELLLDEWYVERHKRTVRFAHIAQIEAEKSKFIKSAKAERKALPAPEEAVEVPEVTEDTP